MATVLYPKPLPLPKFSSQSGQLQDLMPRGRKPVRWLAAGNVKPVVSSGRGGSRRRRTLICAVGKGAEESFKKTVAVDRLVDMLREANPRELERFVAENVLAFDETFWIRLAARSDTCKSEDDKKDYEELAASVMTIVDRIVNKTNEKIESATDILKAILKPVVDEEEEIPWPPRDPDALKLMEAVRDNTKGARRTT